MVPVTFFPPKIVQGHLVLRPAPPCQRARERFVKKRGLTNTPGMNTLSSMMHRRTGSTLEGIESALGTPAHRGDKYLIYQGDCAELMKALPPDFGALTITSPPYNIGKEYEQPRPVAEYLDWCESWIRLVHRFTRRDGAFG